MSRPLALRWGVEGQALQIGFAFALAGGRARGGQLHPAGVVETAAGVGLQAMKAADAYHSQPRRGAAGAGGWGISAAEEAIQAHEAVAALTQSGHHLA